MEVNAVCECCGFTVKKQRQTSLSKTTPSILGVLFCALVCSRSNRSGSVTPATRETHDQFVCERCDFRMRVRRYGEPPCSQTKIVNTASRTIIQQSMSKQRGDQQQQLEQLALTDNCVNTSPETNYFRLEMVSFAHSAGCLRHTQSRFRPQVHHMNTIAAGLNEGVAVDEVLTRVATLPHGAKVSAKFVEKRLVSQPQVSFFLLNHQSNIQLIVQFFNQLIKFVYFFSN